MCKVCAFRNSFAECELLTHTVTKLPKRETANQKVPTFIGILEHAATAGEPALVSEPRQLDHSQEGCVTKGLHPRQCLKPARPLQTKSTCDPTRESSTEA